MIYLYVIFCHSDIVVVYVFEVGGGGGLGRMPWGYIILKWLQVTDLI